jgi:recombination protein RecT
VGSFFQAAALGLEPNTPLGHAFLVPFRNSKKDIVECQLIIGYKGYIDLGYRSKMVKSLEARVVHELDYFEYEEGTEDFIRHKRSEDSKREQSPITHAYAIVKTTTGGRVFQVLTREQIDKRRKRSANARTDYSAWVTDYGPMACKSAIRALHPYIPQSSELAIADSLDRSLDIGETQVLSPEITEVLERQGLVVEEQLNEPPDDIETVTDKE